MKCLSRHATEEWVMSRLPKPVTDLGEASQLAMSGYSILERPLPPDSGRKVYLCRCLCSLMSKEPEMLIDVQRWAIFPSSGHVPLLNRFRQACGSGERIEDSPGHLLSSGEKDDAISILILAVEFFWDCFVLGSNALSAAYISHDEKFVVLSRDAELLSRFEMDLD